MEKEFIKSIIKNRKQYSISSNDGYIKLYKKVYSYYKFQKNDIDLINERNRLKLLKEKENINFLALMISLLALMIASLDQVLNFFINLVNLKNDTNGYILGITVLFVLFIYMVYGIILYIKLAKNDISEKVVYGVAINVIDDIEKELEAKKKLEEIQVEDKNTNYEVLREIAITTSTTLITNVVGSGIIGKFLKKK